MQEALTARIVEAQKRVKQVKSSHEIRVKISRVCSSLDVDGIRGDIVTPSDVKRTIVLALRHRLRKDVFSDIDSGEKVMETFEKKVAYNRGFIEPKLDSRWVGAAARRSHPIGVSLSQSWIPAGLELQPEGRIQ
eukprot:gene18020-24432_t